MDTETRLIGDLAKALVTSGAGSLQRRETSSVQRALDDRMTLSESIEAAAAIVDCYPNGGRDTGKSYLGALAAMLASYPKSVAGRCANRLEGVVRECRFLPTPADIVAWCERETAPLRGERDREFRVARQFEEREEFEHEQTEVRATKLSIAELKAKYGDWQRGWSREEDRQMQRRQARQKLIAEFGHEAFAAIPDAPEREFAQ